MTEELGINTEAVRIASARITKSAEKSRSAGSTVQSAVGSLVLYDLDPAMSPEATRAFSRRICANVHTSVDEILEQCHQMLVTAQDAGGADWCEPVIIPPPVTYTSPPPEARLVDPPRSGYRPPPHHLRVPNEPKGPQVVSMERFSFTADVGLKAPLKGEIEADYSAEIVTLSNGERQVTVTQLNGAATGPGGSLGAKAHVDDTSAGLFGKLEAEVIALGGLGHTYDVPESMSDAELKVWLATRFGDPTGSIAGVGSVVAEVFGKDMPELHSTALVGRSGASYEGSINYGVFGRLVPSGDSTEDVGFDGGVQASFSGQDEGILYTNGDRGRALTVEAAASMHALLSESTTPELGGSRVVPDEQLNESVDRLVRAELITSQDGQARIELESEDWSDDGSQMTVRARTIHLDAEAIGEDSFGDDYVLEEYVYGVLRGSEELLTEVTYDVDGHEAGLSIGFGLGGSGQGDYQKFTLANDASG